MNERPAVAAVGAGRMGRGIAQVFAYAGHPVRLLDLKARDHDAFESLARDAHTEIENSLQALAAAGLFEAGAIVQVLSRIEILPLDRAQQAVNGAEVIFECVPEVAEVKRQAFELIEPLLAPTTILTSTTSTFLVDMLAAMLQRPQQFLNAHWLNPAYLVPLVEISPGERTDPVVVERLKSRLQAIGKVPVVCTAAPGYIVPRIQALAMNEAARMVEEGVASAEDIDRAIRYGFGFRFAVLGLLEFIDWGGGDILYYASNYLRQALNAERFAAPEIIERNMRDGKLGMRSGSGFYDFESMDVERYRGEVLTRFVDLLKHIDAARPPVID